MPTPAVHLALAEDMLRREDLSPATRRFLTRQRGAFLLGHTAPDVRTVSGQRREDSHFYTVPRTSDRPAYQVLFEVYPALVHPSVMSPSQRAFVAGYIAHLCLDELWLDDVFEWLLLQDWVPLRERLFLHNVLRTWIDQRAQARLNGAVARALRQAEPNEWLPFVSDEHLRAWRDWLVQQLGPGQTMETAEVLARRMGIPPSEIDAVARSGREMEEQIFSHFPRSALRCFWETGYERSVLLVDWYIGGRADRERDSATMSLPVYSSTDSSTIEEARV